MFFIISFCKLYLILLNIFKVCDSISRFHSNHYSNLNKSFITPKNNRFKQFDTVLKESNKSINKVYPGSNENRLKLYNNFESSKETVLDTQIQQNFDTISDLVCYLNTHKGPKSDIKLPFTLNIKGFVQEIRRINSKNLYFIDINDGSTVSDLQIVVNKSNDFEQLEKLKNGDYINAVGTVDWRRGVPSERSLSDFDLHIDRNKPEHKLSIYNYYDPEVQNPIVPNIPYPDEYLRKYPLYRFRNKQFQSIISIRNAIKLFISKFFTDNSFTEIDTPCLTHMNCENLSPFIVKTNGESNCYENINENKPLNLSSTGQMELEFACYGLGKVWKIGPSFRAERSDTIRHSNEFLMVEAEWPDVTIQKMINFIQDLIRNCAKCVLTNCEHCVNYLNNFNDKYKEYLKNLSNVTIKTITYDEAITILSKPKQRFSESDIDYSKPIEWGKRLSETHERKLLNYFENQIIAITNYPESITPFYMKSSSNNLKLTVENFDILAPFGYEISGGSIREDEFDILQRKMSQRNISGDAYQNYLNLRKSIYFPHGGFGIGFDRLVMLMTMKENIKDVIPFPVTKF